MNGWEKVESLCKSLAALSVVCVPIVVGYIANEYTESIKNQEAQGRFVEMAVQILRANPSDENKDLREWAIKVIDSYSGVPLSLKAREGLVESILITGPLTTGPHCSKYLQHGRDLLRVEEVQGGIDYLKKAAECQTASGR